MVVVGGWGGGGVGVGGGGGLELPSTHNFIFIGNFG